MQTRQLGANGPTVSAIGLGTMRTSFVPGSGDEETIATIQAALDAGINLLNTGDFYGMGSNELVIGRAIKGRRDDAVISVKFGAMRTHSGAFVGFDGRPNAVKNFAAYSLTRLGVDVIDIYQPARVDPAVPIEETVGAIADLIKEGKVRYLGLSETSADNIRRAHAVHPVTALEIEYSLATRFIENKILPTARELGIGVVAYSVVGQGLLVGDIDGILPPDDPRKIFPRFEDANLVQNLELVGILKNVASRKGYTPAQIAIAWVLSRGSDIVPLVGMSRPARVPENLATLDIRFGDEELAELDSAFAQGKIAGDRYPAHARALAPE